MSLPPTIPSIVHRSKSTAVPLLAEILVMFIGIWHARVVLQKPNAAHRPAARLAKLGLAIMLTEIAPQDALGSKLLQEVLKPAISCALSLCQPSDATNSCIAWIQPRQPTQVFVAQFIGLLVSTVSLTVLGAGEPDVLLLLFEDAASSSVLFAAGGIVAFPPYEPTVEVLRP